MSIAAMSHLTLVSLGAIDSSQLLHFNLCVDSDIE